MEITKDNITQVISALRQCAKEHKGDNTPTCGIIVSELCTDVADYLEKIKNADVIQIPSEEEAVSTRETKRGRAAALDIAEDERSYNDGFADCYQWLKSKTIKWYDTIRKEAKAKLSEAQIEDIERAISYCKPNKTVNDIIERPLTSCNCFIISDIGKDNTVGVSLGSYDANSNEYYHFPVVNGMFGDPQLFTGKVIGCIPTE